MRSFVRNIHKIFSSNISYHDQGSGKSGWIRVRQDHWGVKFPRRVPVLRDEVHVLVHVEGLSHYLRNCSIVCRLNSEIDRAIQARDNKRIPHRDANII